MYLLDGAFVDWGLAHRCGGCYREKRTLVTLHIIYRALAALFFPSNCVSITLLPSRGGLIWG